MTVNRTVSGGLLAGVLSLSFLLPASAVTLPKVVSVHAAAAAEVEAADEYVPESYPVLLGAGEETAEKPDQRTRKACPSRLVSILKEAGYRGENLREAWAIAMRESHGHPKSVSSTHDYGLFQFNKKTFSEEKWWKQKRLLHARYSARIAHRLSEGGRTWYLWGLDGQGEANAHLYRGAGWSDEKIQEYIVKPYQKFYNEYGRLPARCR